MCQNMGEDGSYRHQIPLSPACIWSGSSLAKATRPQAYQCRSCSWLPFNSNKPPSTQAHLEVLQLDGPQVCLHQLLHACAMRRHRIAHGGLRMRERMRACL